MKVAVDDTLEPGLRDYFKALRPVPRRDLVAAAKAKANFLAELEGLFEPDRPVRLGFFDPLAVLIKRKAGLLGQLSPRLYSLTVLFIILALLFSGWAGITARAAASAIPGDSLYSFKTGIEQVRVSLAGDLDKQAGLYLEFAAHRLQEIEKLVDAGRYQKAAALVAKFSLNIRKAREITIALARVNPARAAQRQQEIQAQLAIFSAQLGELMGKMPPAYQPAFNDVIPPVPAPSLQLAPTPLATEHSTPDAVEEEMLKDQNGHLQDPSNNGSEAAPSAGFEDRLESEQQFEDARGAGEEPSDQEDLGNDHEEDSDQTPEGEGEHSERGADTGESASAQPSDGSTFATD